MSSRLIAFRFIQDIRYLENEWLFQA